MTAFRAPDEHRAEERGWRVVAAAYAARTPGRAPRRLPLRPVLALAVVAALAAVAVTTPGRAVVTSVRHAIGLADAARTLSSLPAPGRVLAGGGIVSADGSIRRLGSYHDSSWSPFGRFVVAAEGDRIVALTPTGDVRWQLGRPVTSRPRWGGTRSDTRIAYFSGQQLRVVAGDGTGDRAVAPGLVARVAPAWRAGAPFTLAYADRRGRVLVIQPDTRRVLFRTEPGARPRKLLWLGGRLVVVRPSAIETYAGGNHLAVLRGSFVDAAVVDGRLAVLSPHRVTLGGRTLFSTTGRLGQVVPSPDGRWLLVTWPEADQWLFVPVHGGRVRALGNIRAQLGGGFPVDGWTS